MRIALLVTVVLLAFCEGRKRNAEGLNGALKPRERLQSAGSHRQPQFQTPMASRVDKLKCRYRKSCYEEVESGTGGTSYAPSAKDAEEEKPHQLPVNGDTYTAAQLKLLCKYRTSCYEKRGLNDTVAKGKKKRPTTLLTSKPSRIVTESTHQRHPHTVKDIAKATIRELEERDKHAGQRPKGKLSPGKQLLHEIREGLKSKNACKYRKSCYETGQVPEIEGLRVPSWIKKSATLVALPTTWLQSHTASTPPEEDEERFEEMTSRERRLYCKYRKSCYESGVAPEIAGESKFHFKEVVARGPEKSEQRLELRCRYRKSCYESGVLPPQFSKRGDADGEAQKRPAFSGQKPLPTSIDELRIFCKYRRSCYMKQAHGGAKSGEKVELASLPSAENIIVNATLPQLRSEDAKQPVRGNPHPKVSAIQRRKERRDRLAQTKLDAGGVQVGAGQRPPFSAKRRGGRPKKSIGAGLRQDDETGTSERRANKKKRRGSAGPEGTAGRKLKLAAGNESPPAYPAVPASSKEDERINQLGGEHSKRATQIPLKKKLECLYRKSCYAQIPESELLKLERKPPLQRKVEAGEDSTSRTHRGQQIANEQKLSCKYRKSCYAEILPQMILGGGADGNDDGSSGAAEEHRPTRVRTSSTDGLRLSPAVKLECKYRHSCYSHVQLHQSHLNHSAGKTRREGGDEQRPPVPTPTQEEVPYCNKYWLSCQRGLGLPVKEKAPTGPSGRKLCRKRQNPQPDARSIP